MDTREIISGQLYDLERLKERSKLLRKEVLQLALETNGSHIGGSFSEIEILISLFYKILNHDDLFILSKGHACYPYFLLLREKGFDPKIMGHPEIDPKNGIYCTTGSLGHGLPIGAGMAFARKIKQLSGRIYILMSDGECQEGTTWETSDFLAQHNINNLTAIIDVNKIQALDRIEDVSPLNLKEKFTSFGWHVKEIDGHNFNEIISALRETPDKPYVILADTTKGKGVSYMEDRAMWHGRKVNFERVEQALKELS
ncbi:hypothetical protein CMI42_01995 [Candidatus Pacearchaeota archaeon]|nr:hypothetical protein [Candidatus Pacearchaeota archaeon]|tara:strand:- start:420 stop:1187 length:768 start_codon:yes stop_codon:yes gene_type:complete